MKIAINAQQLAHYSLADVVTFTLELGVEGIELWPENVPGGDNDFLWRGRDIASAAKVIHAAGLKVACVTLGFFALPRAESRQEAVNAVIGALDAAVVADCSLVNLYTAGLPAREFIEIMKLASPEAEKRRVTITLENEAHDDTAFPEWVRDILDEVNSPWVKTQYDPCNYYHAGDEAFPKPLHTLRMRIGYFHLKGGGSYQTGSNIFKGSKMRDSEQPIGYGPISGADFDLSQVVAAMKAEGYQGWVTLEPHVGKDAIKDILRLDSEWLKNELARQNSKQDIISH
jgi:sugar phosphate isomerase/epimerase